MATELKHPKPFGRFSLTDTHDHPFTEASLLGKWTLVFFGYTTCFSICPKTLTTISETWKLLPETLTEDSLRFVFISLDPEADTPKQLQNFLTRFNPRFMGLTGDSAVIQRLSKSSGIYSYEDPDASKAGIKVIDHSATLLLINPKGQVQAVFSPPHDKKVLAKELTELSTAH
jgi:protein SCO1/2